MRRILMVCVPVLFVGAISLAPYLRALEDEKPKHTIKQVMEKAHKNKLLNKVAEGKGTKEDAAELLDLYKALGVNKPPKGEAEDWKKKTTELASAAQEVVDGKEGAAAKLQKAANCGACHEAHKPK